jgi:hypothetical protein
MGDFFDIVVICFVNCDIICFVKKKKKTFFLRHLEALVEKKHILEKLDKKKINFEVHF